MIALPNTPVDAYAYANNTLTLSDNGAPVAHLHLLGSYEMSGFKVTEQGGGTDIAYAAPPSADPPMPAVTLRPH